MKEYPTVYLARCNPELVAKQSRVVREVVWMEMSFLTTFRKKPDVVATLNTVHRMFLNYRRMGYSLPEMLRTYEYLRPENQARTKPVLKPEEVDWSKVPEELIERCLDENFELQVTDELLEFLGYEFSESQSESLFDTVSFDSMYRSSKEGLIGNPVYSRKTDKLVSITYLEFDERVGDFRRVKVSGRDKLNRAATYQELDFVISRLSVDSPNPDPNTGLTPETIVSTIRSLYNVAAKARKEFYRKNFGSMSYLEYRKRRLDYEKERAISLNGRFKEDTSRLWRD